MSHVMHSCFASSVIQHTYSHININHTHDFPYITLPSVHMHYTINHTHALPDQSYRRIPIHYIINHTHACHMLHHQSYTCIPIFHSIHMCVRTTSTALGYTCTNFTNIPTYVTYVRTPIQRFFGLSFITLLIQKGTADDQP